jgi:hypothetical protein
MNPMAANTDAGPPDRDHRASLWWPSIVTNGHPWTEEDNVTRFERLELEASRRRNVGKFPSVNKICWNNVKRTAVQMMQGQGRGSETGQSAQLRRRKECVL